MSLLSFARECELYDFSSGVTHWRYTDADRETRVEGQRYSPATLERGALTQSAESGKLALEVRAPLSLPLLDLWRPAPPQGHIRLDLKRLRVRDGRVQPVWTGFLTNVDDATSPAVLRCEPLSNVVEAPGLRRPWQAACPLVLYAQGPGLCNADPDAHAIVATLTDAQGTRVTSAAFAAFADGHFEGGVLFWTSALGIERRHIAAHIGDTLHLLTPMRLPSGARVTALPGCNRTLGAGGCAKFRNELNYGGQPTLKGLVTPFGNDPLF